jgi:hypothetical protein
MPLPIMRRRFLALPLALAALGVAACGSSSKTTSSASTSTTATSAATTPTASTSVLVGKQTSVALNPATSQLLKENAITVTAVAPATYSKTLVWPVSGGQIAGATVTGTIDHNGGFKLTHGEKSVELTTFVINTSTKQVTALVGEKRIPVYSINTSSEKHQAEAGGVIVDSGLKLTLTEQAASALNGALAVSAFKAGQVFGTATITLAVKP